MPGTIQTDKMCERIRRQHKHGHTPPVDHRLPKPVLPTWFCLYTVNHKKRDILFFTITSANLNRFLSFLYHFNHDKILHTTVVKFITSP